MKQITGYLRQVNTWMVVATLALTGWLIDSLLWYLETHSLTLIGFATFLVHSWYALPLLGAIVVILRLRRSSELLSLTIYDEHGVSIHHQGNFRVEESVLEPIFASFKGQTQESGLHHLELSTGPVIYFFRQGSLTLVACFSGPPRPAQLQAGARLLLQHEALSSELLADLPSDVAALVADLLNAPVERDLLIDLWANRRMTMTADSWAERVIYDMDEVTAALKHLGRLGLVQSQTAGAVVYYRLTQDESRLQQLNRFIHWRDDWLMRVHRVEQLVGPAKLNMNIIGRM